MKRLTIAATLLAAGLSATAAAQTYPNKPIRIIVPFAAGGSADILARTLGQSMAGSLGQPVVIENRPGAGGTIGTVSGLQQPPDGYTLLVGTVATFGAGPAVQDKPGYDPRDAAPIGLVASVPVHVAVNATSPHRSLGALLAAARANPGRLTFASAGVNSVSHLACLQLVKRANVDIVHVPFRGSAPALQDLVAGQVDLICDVEPTLLPSLKGGQIRSLAVAQKTRSASLPDVPTADEAGVPGLAVESWTGLFAPKGTPGSVVDKLNGALRSAVASKDFRQRLESYGARTYAESALSPGVLGQLVKSEVALWQAVVKGGSLAVATAPQLAPSEQGGLAKADSSAASAGDRQSDAKVANVQPAQQPVAVAQQSLTVPSSGPRVALVIGNSDYGSMPRLVNPRNDAEDVAKALKESGFDVGLGVDLTRAGMEDAFSGFSKKARQAETALVYFAGHGIQHNGINYLAPVDARLEDEADLRKLTLLQNVVEDLQGASKIRILLIDACRDNEAVQQLASRLPRTRGAAFTRGLAGASADGTLIAFATQPNRVAVDGSGRNSPFAQAFLKHVATPGLELRTLLTRVRAEVVQATDGNQRPEVSDSLVGEFAFR